MQCSAQEIADWFHVSPDTLDRRLREERGMGFAEFFAKHRTQGKIAVRRNLFQLSAHNAHAAVFLAKNWLGMTEKQETTVIGDATKPVVITGVDAETRRMVNDIVKGREIEPADHADIQ